MKDYQTYTPSGSGLKISIKISGPVSVRFGASLVTTTQPDLSAKKEDA